MSAADDVQTYLAAQGLVDGATGWKSSRQVHDGADRLVVLTADGGPLPEIGTAAGVGSAAVRDPGVQVRVRASRGDVRASEDKAQEIYDALHGLLNTTMDGTTYLRVRALTPGPVPIGHDNTGRPEHTVSFRLMRAQGAPV